MDKTTVFLTGATGFLGTQIARQLLKDPSVQLLVLVRGKNLAEAENHLGREWWDWPELYATIGKRTRIIPGDVTLLHFGLAEEAFQALAASLTHVIHSAADVRLFKPIEVLRQVNVEGTRHVLELGEAAFTHHTLRRFSHVSTAYVAGECAGEISEEHFSDQSGFSSPYEQSKYEAECLVRTAAGHMPVSIFRPGMVVGDSSSGSVKTFNTLYFPLRLYLNGRMRIAPAQSAMRINLVPVDYVAKAIAQLSFNPQAVGLTFHLTPPLADQPSLAEMAEFTRIWARQNMNLRLPKPIFLPIPGLEKIAGGLIKALPHDLSPIAQLLPYFQKQPIFSRTNTDRLLGPYPHRWQDLLPHLLEYAVKYSFWHRTSRTVYEQMIFRMQSRSKPVVYHDIYGEKDHLRPAEEMLDEIEHVISALHALGIRPGERVAIAGLNSSRYLACLVACGLSGVVSVPLYSTCPPDEMQHLLADSQARLLLVGTPQVLSTLPKINFSGQVVSFCRQAIPPTTRPYLQWAEFLALGQGEKSSTFSPAFDSPAILYYTSGTTGQAKAVLFQQTQLRWLAETLGSMYPWYERNRWGSYLSYLPMNHIVEGVLACFSPYFVPAALDIYFLEEFDALQDALKQVRPTIFFSVPRFFEKVRATALENPLIRLFQELPATSLQRRWLAPILRRGLLSKAGLNGARMMIVGAAPSDPTLLQFFADLGIEVHDAFGLTEAPLVTLNRPGHSRRGTLGQPLPETEVRLSADGEIQVRGPQVGAGYLQGGLLHPFPNGWLETGDLGQLSPDGYLSLLGRKKDLIITSYAKNIAPAPIEAKLRALPNVSEAILIGEGRPYCSALIWLENAPWTTELQAAIDNGIAAINACLSHPEQVKKWAILPGHLTIENGALTGSMKVKRSLVTHRQAELIEALYQDRPSPEALYIGSSRRVE